MNCAGNFGDLVEKLADREVNYIPLAVMKSFFEVIHYTNPCLEKLILFYTVLSTFFFVYLKFEALVFPDYSVVLHSVLLGGQYGMTL